MILRVRTKWNKNWPSIPTNSFFCKQILQSSTTNNWAVFFESHTFRSCDSTPNTWHLPCIISGQCETCQTFTLQCFGCPKRRQGRGEIGEIEDDGCITREVLQETWRIDLSIRSDLPGKNRGCPKWSFFHFLRYKM